MDFLFLAGFFTGLCVFSWAAYTYVFSPLSAIPNASFLAPFSTFLWRLPVEYSGKITLELPKLHTRLGPLVRTGPNHISFYSLAIYKTVHAPASAFMKDPQVYSQFVQDGCPALFSITDPKAHAKRRRNMGIIFNRSKVPNLTSIMLEEMSNLWDRLYDLNKESRINLIPACRALESDIVSRFAFGSAIGAIDWLGRSGKLLDVIRNNDLKACMMPLYTALPRVMIAWSYLEEYFFRLFGVESNSTSTSKLFDRWADEHSSRYVNGKTPTQSQGPSFLDTMAGGNIPFQAALSEAKEMLGPGTDTTSLTLAHILWALSLYPSFQAELVSDLTTAGWPIDMGDLEAIPRLVACVKEGIRWTGAAVAMLPRVVPRGGAILAGKYIPGGTIVSSSPVWYLHDEVAFPNPRTYRPGRWLTDESNTLRDDYYIPFSKGPSTCIGIHFSYLELYLSISEILKRYILKTADSAIANIDIEATLPPRLEWVAAVPTTTLEVILQKRL